MCLNPFNIREAGQTAWARAEALDAYVSIPSTSGKPVRRGGGVATHASTGLNPFNIREAGQTIPEEIG